MSLNPSPAHISRSARERKLRYPDPVPRTLVPGRLIDQRREMWLAGCFFKMGDKHQPASIDLCWYNTNLLRITIFLRLPFKGYLQTLDLSWPSLRNGPCLHVLPGGSPLPLLRPDLFSDPLPCQSGPASSSTSPLSETGSSPFAFKKDGQSWARLRLEAEPSLLCTCARGSSHAASLTVTRGAVWVPTS